MKVEKISNSTYRVRKLYNGKRYTVIFDHKPTQKEIMDSMSAKLNDDAPVKISTATFKQSALAYFDLKSNVLSPTTLRSYKSMLNNLPESFTEKKLSDISALDIQKIINDYSANHSPKYVKNIHAFIAVICTTYRPKLDCSCTLPQPKKSEAYIPTDEDIKAILEASVGTKYEIPFRLACLGLRRSEICALTMDDIKPNSIIINKAYVYAGGGWILKNYTKTEESTREIYIPDELYQLIQKNGLFNGYPDRINENLQSYQKKLGIPNFSLHKMRHYFASYAHSIGIPDKYIMAAGGWKTSNVLNSVYKHAQKDKEIEMQKRIAEGLQGIGQNVGQKKSQKRIK